jgi:hypothetical protein
MVATAYADDLGLCASSLNFVQHWTEDHDAKRNYDKSFVITFNETVVQSFFRIEISGTNWGAQTRFPHAHVKSIKEVREVKYLGITIDNNLEMDRHCTQIIKAIRMGTSKS